MNEPNEWTFVLCFTITLLLDYFPFHVDLPLNSHQHKEYTSSIKHPLFCKWIDTKIPATWIAFTMSLCTIVAFALCVAIWFGICCFLCFPNFSLKRLYSMWLWCKAVWMFSSSSSFYHSLCVSVFKFLLFCVCASVHIFGFRMFACVYFSLIQFLLFSALLHVHYFIKIFN